MVECGECVHRNVYILSKKPNVYIRPNVYIISKKPKASMYRIPSFRIKIQNGITTEDREDKHLKFAVREFLHVYWLQRI